MAFHNLEGGRVFHFNFSLSENLLTSLKGGSGAATEGAVSNGAYSLGDNSQCSETEILLMSKCLSVSFGSLVCRTTQEPCPSLENVLCNNNNNNINNNNEYGPESPQSMSSSCYAQPLDLTQESCTLPFNSSDTINSKSAKEISNKSSAASSAHQHNRVPNSTQSNNSNSNKVGGKKRSLNNSNTKSKSANSEKQQQSKAAKKMAENVFPKQQQQQQQTLQQQQQSTVDDSKSWARFPDVGSELASTYIHESSDESNPELNLDSEIIQSTTSLVSNEYFALVSSSGNGTATVSSANTNQTSKQQQHHPPSMVMKEEHSVTATASTYNNNSSNGDKRQFRLSEWERTNFRCSICGKMFKHLTNVSRHKRMIHNANFDSPNLCVDALNAVDGTSTVASGSDTNGENMSPNEESYCTQASPTGSLQINESLEAATQEEECLGAQTPEDGCFVYKMETENLEQESMEQKYDMEDGEATKYSAESLQLQLEERHAIDLMAAKTATHTAPRVNVSNDNVMNNPNALQTSEESNNSRLNELNPLSELNCQDAIGLNLNEALALTLQNANNIDPMGALSAPAIHNEVTNLVHALCSTSAFSSLNGGGNNGLNAAIQTDVPAAAIYDNLTSSANATSLLNSATAAAADQFNLDQQNSTKALLNLIMDINKSAISPTISCHNSPLMDVVHPGQQQQSYQTISGGENMSQENALKAAASINRRLKKPVPKNTFQYSKVRLPFPIEISTEERTTLACNVCNYQFTILSNLRRHKKVYGHYEKHICSKCKDIFTSKERFNNHLPKCPKRDSNEGGENEDTDENPTQTPHNAFSAMNSMYNEDTGNISSDLDDAAADQQQGGNDSNRSRHEEEAGVSSNWKPSSEEESQSEQDCERGMEEERKEQKEDQDNEMMVCESSSNSTKISTKADSNNSQIVPDGGESKLRIILEEGLTSNLDQC